MSRACGAVGLSFVVLVAACDEQQQQQALPLVEVGELLFHDTALSFDRTQSCATCHDPEHAFVDPRVGADGLVRAVSLGDDGVSLGDRNAPTVTYAMFAPRFQRGSRARVNKHNNHGTYEGYLGGMFLDGREPGLAGQAAGPPLNPIEMGMPDKASVVERLRDNPVYVEALKANFGGDIFDDVDAAYAAMAETIAEFERTDLFAPFDSKYDRFTRGEYEMSFKELTGKSLFFSQFTNCSICHQLEREGDPVGKFREPFSGFEYHNIGVPVNEAVRAINGVTALDEGLYLHPDVDDPGERGKFKVPVLRNVAVTGPYMHNGVFRQLSTVVAFYEQFHNPDGHPLNPETGEPWREAEIPETVSADILGVGDNLTDFQIESLVCFLRTLTDARYEHLIEDEGISCAD